MIQILEVSEPKNLKKIMQAIRVDPYGLEIMLPKAVTRLIKINSVSNIAANILKQEMLSLGGDVAVARDALTGRTRKTDCLLMGNLSQLKRLNDKLNKQPFGLGSLADNLTCALSNYQRDKFAMDLGRHKLRLGMRTHIMGIVNLTEDSFSQDGLLKTQNSKLKTQKFLNYIVEHVKKMVRDGADIIDVGGESSRPGAKPVSVREELHRTIPVIKALAKGVKVPISIDTYKPEVAKQALAHGAAIVNDISGLRNFRMVKVIAKYKAGVVIMHMKGNPRIMQRNPEYRSLIDEIIAYLNKAVTIALEGGIDREKIIVDPGIGFGKTAGHNLEILKNLRAFKVLGRPILVGPSRKSFIGKILSVGPQERIFGTVASCVLAAKNGANIVRVHDVKAIKQALRVSEAIIYGARRQ